MDLTLELAQEISRQVVRELGLPVLVQEALVVIVARACQCSGPVLALVCPGVIELPDKEPAEIGPCQKVPEAVRENLRLILLAPDDAILQRIVDGHGRRSDVDLLLDVCDNISPGIAWPPKQTTICPLGPSAVSPIASAVSRFRADFEARIGTEVPVTVPMNGQAYRPAPDPAEVAS